MPSNRYYTPDELKIGKTILLVEDEWHHLHHVLRGKIGEDVELINGKGKLALARIEQISKKQGSLSIHTLLQELPPPQQVILALAISRMNHLEWAIEKGTELGATAFWLFPGKLSEKEALSENQSARLKSLILAATKQCGRLYLPELLLTPALHKWDRLEGSLFVCDTAPEVPYFWQIEESQNLKNPVIFFIGPEKGLTAQEVQLLKTQFKARSIKLHDHILRTETAPLVALSLIQQWFS